MSDSEDIVTNGSPSSEVNAVQHNKDCARISPDSVEQSVATKTQDLSGDLDNSWNAPDLQTPPQRSTIISELKTGSILTNNVSGENNDMLPIRDGVENLLYGTELTSCIESFQSSTDTNSSDYSEVVFNINDSTSHTELADQSPKTPSNGTNNTETNELENNCSDTAEMYDTIDVKPHEMGETGDEKKILFDQMDESNDVDDKMEREVEDDDKMENANEQKSLEIDAEMESSSSIIKKPWTSRRPSRRQSALKAWETRREHEKIALMEQKTDDDVRDVLLVTKSEGRKMKHGTGEDNWKSSEDMRETRVLRDRSAKHLHTHLTNARQQRTTVTPKLTTTNRGGHRPSSTIRLSSKSDMGSELSRSTEKLSIRTVHSDRRPGKRGRRRRNQQNTPLVMVLDDDDDDDDPYSLSNLDQHPKPLQFVQVTRGSFGSVTYTKTPPNISTNNRYERTEKAAVERRSNLGVSTPIWKLDSKTAPTSALSRTRDRKSQTQMRHAPVLSDSLFDDVQSRMDEDDDQGSRKEEAAEKLTPKRGPGRPAGNTGKKWSCHDSDPISKRRPSVSVPQLSPSEQLSVDKASCLSPGSRVLARWTDKNFYPGWVVNCEGFGLHMIKYVDNKVRNMPGPDVVPLASLLPGKTCMVAVDDDELQPIEIISSPDLSDEQCWLAGRFHVLNRTNEEEQDVFWQKLVIDLDQTRDFVTSLVNPAAQDVVAGQMPMPTLRNHPDIFAANINCSNVRRSRRSRPESCSQNVVEPTRKRPTLIKKQTKTDEENEHLCPESAPVPVVTIFNGLYFILTSANRKIPSDSADESPQMPPFNKREVRQLLEARGGTVIDDFATVDSSSSVFLVADISYRTHKYLSALTRGVQCVSHTWVHHCAEQARLVDHRDYLLPAGLSVESEQLVEWHNLGPTLLQGLTVFVHSENRRSHSMTLDFVEIWGPLVTSMGAKVVQEMPQDGKLDVLLTDPSCSESVLTSAQQLGAMVVSSEWLIQTVIMGHRAQPAAHIRYDYAYTEQIID